MARKKDEQPLKAAGPRHAPHVAVDSARLTGYATQALEVAKQLGIEKKPLKHFWLSPAQRDVIGMVPTVTKTIKIRLANDDSSFTVAEVARMMIALIENLHPHKQLAHLLVARHLMERLQETIARPKTKEKPKPKTKAAVLYQFKITLLGIKPSIWRRIQVWDGTLDKFHEHIQTAMGWTNSHLHHFKIGGQLHGDPQLIDENFDMMNYADSTCTNLSDILPKPMRFSYEYDFGDCWNHEVLFEGCPNPEPANRYPVCLEGERSCPPEDVGGITGYANFLEVLADPKDEEHKRLRTWVGRKFNAEKFDAKQATKAMKKGLPDWRSEVI